MVESMITRVKEKTGNFSIICNEVLRRSDLSARAKGLWAYIMTLPDDWTIRKGEIFTHFAEGKTALDSAWSELIEAGYIIEDVRRNDDGTLDGKNYIIHETVEPITQNPASVIPQSVDPPLLSTKRQPITKRTNTNIAPTLNLVPEEATAAPSVPKDTSLFHAIEGSFLAAQPIVDGKKQTFTNYGKEAKAIKTIEERIQKQSLDDPLHRAKLVLTTFYTLTKTGSEFWRGQPFIPSALASSGIWDRVMLEVDRGTKEAEAVNDVSWVE